MNLVEVTQVAAAVLPLDALRDHLRLGRGFADDAVQDSVLEGCVRAALAAVETRTGKVVLERRFCWRLDAWRDLARQVLPLAPVSALVSLSILDRFEAVEEIATARYRLVADAHRPVLVASGFVLPLIPVAGRAEIVFDAGFGPEWADVPADLARAVLMLAARYHARRGDLDAGPQPMPGDIEALLAPYRPMRLFGGRA